MLSRIAESLFWIGRYVERADDTARILDAFLARILEDPWVDEDAACRSLLAILGTPPTQEQRLTSGDVLELMAFDAANPSSITGAMDAARDNARGARETISSEMWECLNVTWHTLPSRRIAAERLGPALFLGYVRERSALLAGLAESTMSRDDGWRFLVLGRSLERVDMTSRLLSIQALTPEYASEWRTVLRACGADESFLRTHGGDGGAPTGFGVPVARSAIPAVGAARAHRGGGVPGGAGAVHGAGRHGRRRPAAGRPGADQAGVRRRGVAAAGAAHASARLAARVRYGQRRHHGTVLRADRRGRVGVRGGVTG